MSVFVPHGSIHHTFLYGFWRVTGKGKNAAENRDSNPILADALPTDLPGHLSSPTSLHPPPLPFKFRFNSLESKTPGSLGPTYWSAISQSRAPIEPGPPQTISVHQHRWCIINHVYLCKSKVTMGTILEFFKVYCFWGGFVISVQIYIIWCLIIYEISDYVL